MGGKRLDETKFWTMLLNVEKALLGICSVMTVLLISASVLMRYVLKLNFYGSEEIIIIFAFWLYFLGAAYGSFENSHIKADLASVYIKSERLKDAISLVASMVTVFVNVIFIKWAYDYVLWDILKMPRSTGLKLPLILPHGAIFIGMLLMFFYHAYYLYADMQAYFKNQPRVSNRKKGGEI